MFTHHPRRLLNLLLYITAFTFLTTWLPFLRSIFDGSSYEWGSSLFNASFQGQGLSGDFWYPALNAALGLALFYAFYWIKRRIIFHLLLLLWYVPMAGNVYYNVFLLGERYEFHGDTLGIHLELAWVAVPLATLFLGLVLYAIFRLDDLELVARATWGPRNRFWLILLAALLPLQFLLLATGQPHGTTDAIGVLITIAQCLLLPQVFRYYPKSEVARLRS